MLISLTVYNMIHLVYPFEGSVIMIIESDLECKFHSL